MIEAVLVFCGVFMLRNVLVGGWFQRRINRIHQINQARIDVGNFKLLDYEQELPSYESVLFNLLAWTYQSAFPELPDA